MDEPKWKKKKPKYKNTSNPDVIKEYICKSPYLQNESKPIFISDK